MPKPFPTDIESGPILTPFVRPPKFSFVSPGQSAVMDCHGLCLPLYDFSDLRFQTLTYSGTILSSGSGTGSTPPDFTEREYKVIALKGVDCDELPTTGSLPALFNGTEHLVSEVSAYTTAIDFKINPAADTWEEYNALLDAAGFETIEPGDCFRLFIYSDLMDCESRPCNFISRSLHYCTSCFQRVEDTCYTSVIEYKCNENSMDFIYKCDDGHTLPAQRVRLPFYLKEPQLNSDSDVIKFSDQSIVKLTEVISREYTLETMAMPFEWHTKLKVALAHDSVKIVNENMDEHETPGMYSFAADADYKIKWQKHPSLLGKAEAKLTHANAIAMRNLNCG